MTDLDVLVPVLCFGAFCGLVGYLKGWADRGAALRRRASIEGVPANVRMLASYRQKRSVS